MHFNALDFYRQRTPERLFKPEAGCGGDYVDSPRGNSDLENGFFLEILLGQILQRGTKAAQCTQDGICILWRRHNPNIDVHRRSRIAMGGQGVGAHEKESNLLVGQGLQHFSVIFVQHRDACSETRLRGSAARRD